MIKSSSVIITGASGLLGRQLVKKISQCGYTVIALGRNRCPEEIKSNCEWQQTNIEHPQSLDIDAGIIIHAAPLWLLPDFIRVMLSKGKFYRCVAFSSTSAVSKAMAANQEDRKLANKLLKAESEVTKTLSDQINTTIIRPTLIYGYGKDKNISVIASFITKYKFFPVAGKAAGLRQPVHVDDLVDATTAILDNELTFGKTYILSGAETLDYRTMIEKIFKALNHKPRIIRLPVKLYRILLKLFSSNYSSGAADRMNQDLNFNDNIAAIDFGYQPQNFLINPNRDLPGL